MNPEFTLQLFAVLIISFLCCLGKKPEPKAPDASKPKKKQVINIIDSVVQRSNFNNEDDEESNEAVSALIALGYRKRQAKEAVGRAYHNGLTIEQVIKGALQII